MAISEEGWQAALGPANGYWSASLHLIKANRLALHQPTSTAFPSSAAAHMFMAIAV